MERALVPRAMLNPSNSVPSNLHALAVREPQLFVHDGQRRMNVYAES